jgi:hypothetical protein
LSSSLPPHFEGTGKLESHEASTRLSTGWWRHPKATVDLVTAAQRQQRRLFELGLVAALEAVIELGQILRQANHLEGALRRCGPSRY